MRQTDEIDEPDDKNSITLLHPPFFTPLDPEKKKPIFLFSINIFFILFSFVRLFCSFFYTIYV